jgi:isoquinoline 1-oxidoreductase alpha subunit
MAITITVNGVPRDIAADPSTPLLWVLRDHLSLLGTKFGCGAGLCGACTVHLNGNAIRSCVTPLASVAGQRVTTIEGLSSDGQHPLQIAWHEVDVPQCGYCQAGQIMTAASLLSVKPQPTDDEIVEAMSGNICRCGTYLRIRQAVRMAADRRTS